MKKILRVARSSIRPDQRAKLDHLYDLDYQLYDERVPVGVQSEKITDLYLRYRPDVLILDHMSKTRRACLVVDQLFPIGEVPIPVLHSVYYWAISRDGKPVWTFDTFEQIAGYPCRVKRGLSARARNTTFLSVLF